MAQPSSEGLPLGGFTEFLSDRTQARLAIFDTLEQSTFTPAAKRVPSFKGFGYFENVFVRMEAVLGEQWPPSFGRQIELYAQFICKIRSTKLTGRLWVPSRFIDAMSYNPTLPWQRMN